MSDDLDAALKRLRAYFAPFEQIEGEDVETLAAAVRELRQAVYDTQQESNKLAVELETAEADLDRWKDAADDQAGPMQAALDRAAKAEAELAALKDDICEAANQHQLDPDEDHDKNLLALVAQRDALRADLREHEAHAAKCHRCGNWTCGYCGLDDEQGHWHCERCAGTGPLAKAESDLARARADIDSKEALLRQLAKDGRLWIDQIDLQAARVRMVYAPESELARARAVLETARDMGEVLGIRCLWVDDAAWQAWREGQK